MGFGGGLHASLEALSGAEGDSGLADKMSMLSLSFFSRACRQLRIARTAYKAEKPVGLHHANSAISRR